MKNILIDDCEQCPFFIVGERQPDGYCSLYEKKWPLCYDDWEDSRSDKPAFCKAERIIVEETDNEL